MARVHLPGTARIWEKQRRKDKNDCSRVSVRSRQNEKHSQELEQQSKHLKQKLDRLSNLVEGCSFK